MRSIHLVQKACAVIAAMAAIAVAEPAEARDPAVSVTNLKVTGAGGSSDGDGAWLGVAG